MIYVLGGGTSLNFKIAGGTTQPASPAENTIWVNTSTTISEWVFSATQPTSPTAGMVWFRTGLTASAAFNALKKNGITVYPTGCKQYVSGTWVGKTAKTYMGGSWASWVYTAVPNTSIVWTNSDGCAVAKTNSNTKIDTKVSSNHIAYAYFAVDLSNYSEVKIKAELKESDGGGANVTLQVGIFDDTSLSNFVTGYTSTLKNTTVTVDNTYDVSEQTGIYYFGYRFEKTSGTSEYTTYCDITELEFY